MATKAMPSAEQSVLPTYLQGTIYGTLEMTHLLTVLNTPSVHEYAAARAVLEEFLTHGKTRHLFELFKAKFTGVESLAVHLVSVKLDGVDETVVLPTFAHTGAALHRLITSKDPWRLKRCQDDGCQEFFFDDTKTGKKQYCTRRCVARVQARLHRQRARQAPSSSLA